MKKKVIFNCTTNNAGGAVQNSVNFINEIINNDGYGIDWFYFVSSEVAKQIKDLVPKRQLFICQDTPAKSVKARWEIYKKANKIQPDLIYTSAGPAYIKFKQPHIMGCSNPYVLGATKESLYKNRGLVKRLLREIHTIYQRHYIKKAKYWIVQTEESKRQLNRILKKELNIFIVYNAISAIFFKAHQDNKYEKKALSDENCPPVIKVLIPSAWYAHKDLETVPLIIKNLYDKGKGNIKVTFTIDEFNWNNIIKIATQLGVENHIYNYGPFSRKEAVNLYNEHDIILQPSLLEVFSTSYIEAMAIKKPLVVPFLPFSKDICGDYAYYYECNNYDEYADSIIAASRRINFPKKVLLGNEIVSRYGTQQKRTENIIGIIKEILTKECDKGDLYV